MEGLLVPIQSRITVYDSMPNLAQKVLHSQFMSVAFMSTS